MSWLSGMKRERFNIETEIEQIKAKRAMIEEDSDEWCALVFRQEQLESELADIETQIDQFEYENPYYAV